jgi:hypothetical protein
MPKFRAEQHLPLSDGTISNAKPVVASATAANSST